MAVTYVWHETIFGFVCVLPVALDRNFVSTSVSAAESVPTTPKLSTAAIISIAAIVAVVLTAVTAVAFVVRRRRKAGTEQAAFFELNEGSKSDEELLSEL